MRSYLFVAGISGFSLFAMNTCSADGVDFESGGWDRDASADIADTGPGTRTHEPSSVAAKPVVQPEVQPVVQPEPVEDPTPTACPADMLLVEGKHCLDVVQKCIDYMEDPIKNPFARCREFENPSVCKGERVTLRFCMDRLEVGGDDGLPLADKSWTEAKGICESKGKRLCQEREWLFACEGEDAHPYPYGFVRNPKICNFERTEDLVTNKGDLADHRQPVTANPACLSPFGVQNMVGNIDEWVVLDKPHWSTKNRGQKMNSGLKGGWWGPLRNRCRPTTVDHDEVYHALQTGVRCCKDAE